MARTTTPTTLTASEARILRMFRALTPDGRRAIDALLVVCQPTKRKKVNMGAALADVYLKTTPAGKGA
jgi:hypothetical protein